jgi:hypothetical protein
LEIIEPNFRQLVADYLNGSVSDELVMVKLGIQVIAILVVGLVLWRISSVFSKKKQSTRKTVFMGSRFQDKWKNKQ